MTVSLYKLCLAGLILIVLGLPLAGGGALLQILFPVLALAIGGYTLLNSPTRNYIQFVMLLWMFAPFVRRLADWQSGHSEFSPVVVTPLIVTMLSFLILPNRWPGHKAKLLYSFLIYLAIVLWGGLISLASGTLIAAIYVTLTWIAPVGLALLILANDDKVDQINETLCQTMVRGGLVMAIYGIAQFALMPAWDRAWVISSGLTSLGPPVPYQIRVFSTMNISGILAGALMISLLTILNRPSLRGLIAGAPIALCFGLTLVRSIWGGFLLGVLLLMVMGPVRVKLRVVMISGALLAISIPIVVQSSFFTGVSERAETLFALEEDRSLSARLAVTEKLLADVPSLLTGHGVAAASLGAKLSGDGDDGATIDNGILHVVFTFGVAGILMLALLCYWAVIQFQALRALPAMASSAVAALVGIAMMLFSDKLPAPYGVFIFPFLALSAAAYHRQQARNHVATAPAAARTEAIA